MRTRPLLITLALLLAVLAAFVFRPWSPWSPWKMNQLFWPSMRVENFQHIDGGQPFANGMVSIYMSPSHFGSEDALARETRSYIDFVRSSRPAVPGDPTALTRALSVTKLLTASGPRSQTFEYDVYQGVIGLRGRIPGTALDFDVYGSIGQTHFTNIQYNDTSRANIAAVLNGTANFTGSAGSCIGYAWNPFGNNPFSPGCEQFVTRDNVNINTTRQQVIEGTISGPIEFGMMWRIRMRAGLRPMTMAASTYSCERWTSTRLWARRANFGHQTTSMAMMVLSVPMPSAAAIASARMIGGKHSTRSVMRMITSSVRPRA